MKDGREGARGTDLSEAMVYEGGVRQRDGLPVCRWVAVLNRTANLDPLPDPIAGQLHGQFVAHFLTRFLCTFLSFVFSLARKICQQLSSVPITGFWNSLPSALFC